MTHVGYPLVICYIANWKMAIYWNNGIIMGNHIYQYMLDGLPSGNLLKSELENHHFIAGKINY